MLNGKKVVYIGGVWDLFHIGHLNIIKRAQNLGDFIIVGVSTDLLVSRYKNAKTVIPEQNRLAIIKALSGIDLVVLQHELGSVSQMKELKVDIFLTGDDWKDWKSRPGNSIPEGYSWIDENLEMIFLPRTAGISSTSIKRALNNGHNSRWNPFIVVSYYTVNTLYESKARGLIKTLQQFEIPYYVERIASLGSWIQNVNFKPIFIKKMLKRFPSINIVWVDCDAEFHTFPELFNTLSCTVAVHNFDRSCYKNNKGPAFEILSGTIFIKNSVSGLDIVQEWADECGKNPKVWDQRTLEKVLDNNFYDLLPEYCHIFDRMPYVKKPVITHFQASREVRRRGGSIT